MPGSPFFSSLFEGFNERREGAYQENLKSEADARAQEAKVYEYLLQSRDPEIASLALSGMMESARPGTRKKGLRGWLGEVQQSETFPQIKQAMGEMVPDEAPPARPGSAALPSTTPVHGGPSSAPASPTGQLPGRTLAPEAAPAGVTGAGGPSALATDVTAGAPPPGPPLPPAGPGAASMVGAPPPEHPMHRRGTGIPTAEEIAGATESAKERAQLEAFTSELRAAGATDEQIRQAIMGRAGAPMRMGAAAAGPMMADPDDPATPIPTIRTTDSQGVVHVTLIDGTPVPTNYVGYAKPSSAGQATKTIRDPKSPSGYSAVTYAPDGTETRRVPTEFVPPPAYSGTVTLDAPDSPTGRQVVGVTRGGGTGPALGNAPVPAGEATPEEAEAKGWVAAVQAKVKEGQLPGLNPRPGRFDQVTREVSKGKYQSYQDLQAAAQKSSNAPAAGGGDRGSLADRIRRRIDSQRGTPPPGPPGPPPRTGGPGPVGSSVSP